MLTLVLGRAGTGKTTYVMEEIRRRGNAGQTGLILIVPEQYSHNAEKQLNAVCGDKLSMYGETLTITRLCGRVFSETGGAPEYILDAGGQILVMHRALEAVSQRLNVFGAKGLRAELLEKLLDAVKEFKSLNITPVMLERMAEQAANPLRGKLRDLSLIYDAYDALLHEHGCDSADRLTLLADLIEHSSVGDAGHIYFDGFNDFTAQELCVIEKLLKKNAELTICLTCDPQSADGEAFMLPNKTAARLKRLASKYNAECRMQNAGLPDCGTAAISLGSGTGSRGSEPRNQMVSSRGGEGDEITESRSEELVFLERHLFEHGNAVYPGGCGAITLYSAPTIYTECEYAAYITWKLVRGGYRWRDISVMSRNWEEYGPICENIFEKYGIPFFSGGRADILDKPPAALIDAALEAAISGLEYRSVFKYLKTGLTGIAADDCSELENYIIKWNIRGIMWAREWTLPLPGYENDDEGSIDALARINSLRRSITGPLTRLRDGIKGDSEARTKLLALHGFLYEIRFPEHLAEKADELEKRGEARLAGEYAQLWEIIKNAMEQMHVILGSTLGAAEFRKLFLLTLSQYDVGVIPVALDRTALGGMAMSRSRDLKCLIVLGATDDNMPMLAKGSGALTDSEREELSKLGVDMPAGIEERYYREMNMIYSTLTLPSRELVITYPTGGAERPSFIVKRITSMFGINAAALREEEYMTAAVTPCFELAMTSVEPEIRNTSVIVAAAREYFRKSSHTTAMLLAEGDEILRAGRGRLSETAAEKLYGREVPLSSSRVDKYYSCPFLHFAQNGLRLKPRIQAEFDAPEAGIFMHFVLEGVAREIKESVGLKNANEDLCRNLTARYIEQYVHDALFDFEGKNARFVYLFRRLEKDVTRIVLDILRELQRSDFEPLDFELDFSQLDDNSRRLAAGGRESPDTALKGSAADAASPYLPISSSGSHLMLNGVIDRVDGWEHDGKLFLRVIDYKTGRITFNLPDVVYGRNMQMLIYLFTLQKHGKARYGIDIEPAGVLYAPVRDFILSLPRDSSEERIMKEREKVLRRSGIVLDEPDVIEAMENGSEKKYLPVKLSKDGMTGDSLVSQEQIAMLSEYVDYMLHRAVREILGGSIECRPYYKGAENNACSYCEYITVCAFDEDAGDKRRYIGKMGIDDAWAELRQADKLTG